MFRKMSHEELPVDDCHFRLRQEHHKAHGTNPGQIFISIAWDWCFIGSSGPSFKDKLRSVLEADDRNRQNNVLSLLLPSFTILWMAYLGLKSRILTNGFMVADFAFEAVSKIYERENASLEQLEGDSYKIVEEPDIVEASLGFSLAGVYLNTSYMCTQCNAEICHYYIKVDGDSAVYCVSCAAKTFPKCSVSRKRKRKRAPNPKLQLRTRRFTTEILAKIKNALSHYEKAIEELPDEDHDNVSISGDNLMDASEVDATNSGDGSANRKAPDKDSNLEDNYHISGKRLRHFQHDDGQSTDDSNHETSPDKDEDSDWKVDHYVVTSFTLRGKNLRTYESKEEQPREQPSQLEFEQEQLCHVDIEQEQLGYLDPVVEQPGHLEPVAEKLTVEDHDNGFKPGGNSKNASEVAATNGANGSNNSSSLGEDDDNFVDIGKR